MNKILIMLPKSMLQVYPNERHSLRHLDASEHYETVLLTFLRNCL